MSQKFLLSIVLIALSGCQASSRGEHNNDNFDTEARDLCVSSSCGEVVELVNIPDAENIHFTPNGRLFVTGGSNAYEITKNSDDSFNALELSESGCNFTGMAQKDQTVYFVCGDGQLFAMDLDGANGLELIYQMDGMCIANGTALGPDGNLYIIDEPLNPACVVLDPKIVRLTLDPADTSHVLQQETWLASSGLGLLAVGVGDDVRFPNGLVQSDGRFYSTDGGTIFYVDLLEDGSAGPVTPIFFEATAHDDLSLAGDTLLVTDFFGGRIFQLSLDGEILQETASLTFDSPSAVQVASPPMFRPDDILVTEKGVLTEQNLPIDVLSVFRRIDSQE